jgi:hypothetical protein
VFFYAENPDESSTPNVFFRPSGPDMAWVHPGMRRMYAFYSKTTVTGATVIQSLKGLWARSIYYQMSVQYIVRCQSRVSAKCQVPSA